MAARMMLGFRVSGPIESPPIFRPRSVVTPTVDIQGNMAKAGNYVYKLERRSKTRRRDPESDEAVHRLVQKDLDKKFMRRGMDKAEVNQKYGVGKYLPLDRFAIQQGFDPDGNTKWRAIDNGAAAETNEMTAT